MTSSRITYLSTPSKVTLAADPMFAAAKATWIDPRTGESGCGRASRLHHSVGWEDALLLLTTP